MVVIIQSELLVKCVICGKRCFNDIKIKDETIYFCNDVFCREQLDNYLENC